MKIGRNDPCPCGSGKKYKKCHLYYDQENASVKPVVKKVESTSELEAIRQEMMNEQIGRRRALEPLGIYINFVKPIIFKGRKCWALGSRVYYQRPPTETFHEFIIFILYQTLGEQFRDEQKALPEDKQHFIYRCAVKYDEWRAKNVKDKNIVKEGWAALPDGWTRALISLAFDVCSLVHTEHLPNDLLNRLRNRDQYQGARYEIAIAGMFSRLGYKITFLDELGTKTTHPEFIAEDRKSGEKIAVEVKSKQRQGILHTQGKTKPEELLWGDIQRLYRHALTQNPGNIPFIIFIDINAPQTPGIQWQNKPWVKDIQKMIKKSPLHNTNNPDKCTGLIFTNYSYHYQTEKEALSGEHLLTWPLYPSFPVKDGNFLTRIENALTNYGNIPNLDTVVGH